MAHFEFQKEKEIRGEIRQLPDVSKDSERNQYVSQHFDTSRKLSGLLQPPQVLRIGRQCDNRVIVTMWFK